MSAAGIQGLQQCMSIGRIFHRWQMVRDANMFARWRVFEKTLLFVEHNRWRCGGRRRGRGSWCLNMILFIRRRQVAGQFRRMWMMRIIRRRWLLHCVNVRMTNGQRQCITPLKGESTVCDGCLPTMDFRFKKRVLSHYSSIRFPSLSPNALSTSIRNEHSLQSSWPSRPRSLFIAQPVHVYLRQMLVLICIANSVVTLTWKTLSPMRRPSR